MMQPLNVPDMAIDGLRLIEASAGTGKTHAIANLYLRVLLTHRVQAKTLSVRQILVVTFTTAATEELRDRIRARIQDAIDHLDGRESELDDDCHAILAALDADARLDASRRLRAAMAGIDEAAIFTIHSFCQRTLRDHAFESGQPFAVELLTDTGELLDEVIADCFRVHLYTDAPLARCLFQRGIRTPDALRELLKPLLDGPVRLATPDSGMHQTELLALVTELKNDWRKNRQALIDAVLGFNGWQSRKKPQAGWLESLARQLDKWANSDDLTPDVGSTLWFSADVLQERIEPAQQTDKNNPANVAFMRGFASLVPALASLESRFLASAMAWCRAQLRSRKEQRGLASFNDLIERLRAAIDDPHAGLRLIEKIGAQYPVALIDEFQDTDPDQYRIFSRIYGDAPTRSLLMIGDPKQAIYSFRGADIFAYLEAKKRTRDDACYTMATNWRSTRPLVAAVNALFDRHADPFLFGERIGFEPVLASGRAEEKPLRIAADGDNPPPFRFWFVARPENASGVLDSGDWYATVDNGVAGEIARLLTLARAGTATVGDAPLQPRDIAVLVRTHFEGQRMQAALRLRGVGAALSSRDSVFSTPECTDLLAVLNAFTDPGNDGLLRRAMATPVWGLDAAGLATVMDDGSRWDLALERARSYQQHWLAHGFMPMFRLWLHQEEVANRLLTQGDGNRVLTNLLHLAELAQTAAAAHPAPESLCRWLATALHDGGGDAEEQQLRLESDENLVQIVTLHKSKGLQYPVVFLPTLGRMPTDRGQLNRFHDAAHNDALTCELRSEGAHREQHDLERLQEDLRLVYVALTRAVHRCYVPWGALKGGEGCGLHWLLHGDASTQPDAAFRASLGSQSDADIFATLRKLAEQHPQVFAVSGVPDGADTFVAAAEDAAQFSARKATVSVDTRWTATSFSGLSAGQESRYRRRDYGVAGEDAEGALPASRDMAAFPRGRDAGHVFHGVLECVPLDASPAVLQEEARLRLARYGISEDWAPVIAAGLNDVLHTAIDASGFRLCDLGSRRISEMEFNFRLTDFRYGELAAALPDRLQAATPQRLAECVDGLMRGAIDMVFERDGKWYLADWKSNWLGASADAYHGTALQDAIDAHHYDLQYLVYSVALHRLLRQRLGSAYSYDSHFGGAWYFFLRGMTPATGPARGVFFARPDAALIEKLDRLFDSRSRA